MQNRRDPGVGHILLVGRVGKEQRSDGHGKVNVISSERDPETNLRRPGHGEDQESPSCRHSEGPGGRWHQGGLAATHCLGRRVGTTGKHLAADSRSKRVGIWLPGGLVTEASTRARTSGFRGRAAAPGRTGAGGGGGRKSLEGMGVDEKKETERLLLLRERVEVWHLLSRNQRARKTDLLVSLVAEAWGLLLPVGRQVE